MKICSLVIVQNSPPKSVGSARLIHHTNLEQQSPGFRYVMYSESLKCRAFENSPEEVQLTKVPPWQAFC